MGQPRKFSMLYDKEWATEKYLVEKLSLREIGELVGCKWSTVGYAFRRQGIVDTKRHYKKHDTMTRFKNHSGYVFVYMPSHPDSKKGTVT